MLRSLQSMFLVALSNEIFTIDLFFVLLFFRKFLTEANTDIQTYIMIFRFDIRNRKETQKQQKKILLKK
jgi:hypothetical protein